MSFSLILNGDRGKNYPSKSKLHDDAGIPFVSAMNIKDGTIDSSNLKYLDEQQYEALNAGKLMQSDILFCIRGSLGKCGVYPYEQGAIASSLVILRQVGSDVDADLIEKSYLLFLLASPLTFVQIRKMQNGTAQPNLSAAVLGDFLYPIPPFAEQNRIVEKIDEIKPFVDEYGKAHERREQLDRELPIKLRKSILQAAVEGKLTEQSDDDEPASLLLAGIREKRTQLVREGKAKPVKGGESIIYRDDAGHWFERRGKSDPVCIDEEIPFDIPDSWCWARLESISNFGSCLNIEYNDVAGGTWNLDLEDIQKDSGVILRKKYKHDDEQASTKHIFIAGMVLYSKLRPYLNKVVIADGDGVCSSEILPVQFDELNAGYAQVFLMSPYFLTFANAHVSGTKMPRLRVSDGKQCLMPIPPLTEQKRVVEKVGVVLEQVSGWR